MAEDLLTPTQAAAILTISVKLLRELVNNGDIAFIPKGRGTKRPRMAFTQRDIEDFINRRRQVKACPSTSPKTRRSTTTISSAGVFDFAALRAKRAEERRKR